MLFFKLHFIFCWSSFQLVIGHLFVTNVFLKYYWYYKNWSVFVIVIYIFWFCILCYMCISIYVVSVLSKDTQSIFPCRWTIFSFLNCIFELENLKILIMSYFSVFKNVSFLFSFRIRILYTYVLIRYWLFSSTYLIYPICLMLLIHSEFFFCTVWNKGPN